MKAPAFWYRPAGVTAALLQPLGCLYDLAGRMRRSRSAPRLVGVPVVCVGNLVAGGAGKTPLALAIAETLAGWGLAPQFLSRGYGGRLAGPVRVAPHLHEASDVGDEALLLAERAPTWVARDRGAGALAAVAEGARSLVLDDGFQNFSLAYRLAVVVVDGATGFGNRRVIPAGPLRESVDRGLARASALVVMGEDQTGIATEALAFAASSGGHLPVFHARLEPDHQVAETLRGQRVMAFAGIGRPAKFFETLEHLGAHVLERVAFADHQPYEANRILHLIERAHRLRAELVTTTKDFARLPPAVRSRVRVLPVTIAWRSGGAFTRLLASAVDHHEPPLSAKADHHGRS
ncbi:MAG: tetraacyldisaccharide 4'-kinase [Rhodospirillaceae bacterium]